jgi:hypothetical protein
MLTTYHQEQKESTRMSERQINAMRSVLQRTRMRNAELQQELDALYLRVRHADALLSTAIEELALIRVHKHAGQMQAHRDFVRQDIKNKTPVLTKKNNGTSG